MDRFYEWKRNIAIHDFVVESFIKQKFHDIKVSGGTGLAEKWMSMNEKETP